MRKFVFSMAAAVLCMLAIGSQAHAQAELVGTWVTKPGVGPAVTLVLNDDGTGLMDTTRILYQANDRQIAVKIGNDTTTYNYVLDGNVLTVSGGDLDQPLVFQRKGAASGGKHGIGGFLGGGGQQGGGGGGDVDDAHPAAAVGVWSLATDKGNQYLVLYANGTGEFNRNPLRWAYQNGTLILDEGNNNIERLTVQFNGDTMVMQVSNGSVQWHRQVEGGSDSSGGGGSGGGNQQMGNDAAAILGVWKSDAGEIVEFRTDGTAILGQQQFPFTFGNGVLTLSGPKGSVQWQCQIQGDSMILVINNQQTHWTRQASGQPAAGNPAGQPGGYPNGQPAGNPAGNANAGNDPDVIGRWQAQDGTTFEFTAEGMFIFQGNQAPYTARNGIISVQTPKGMMQLQYVISGNTMSIMFNGQTDTLQRVSGPNNNGGRGGFSPGSMNQSNELNGFAGANPSRRQFICPAVEI